MNEKIVNFSNENAVRLKIQKLENRIQPKSPINSSFGTIKQIFSNELTKYRMFISNEQEEKEKENHDMIVNQNKNDTFSYTDSSLNFNFHVEHQFDQFDKLIQGNRAFLIDKNDDALKEVLYIFYFIYLSFIILD